MSLFKKKELKFILMILIIDQKMINHIFLLLMKSQDIIIIYHFHLFLLFKNFHLILNLKLSDLIYLALSVPYSKDYLMNLFLQYNHLLQYH